jgi:hypothetical protein
VENKRQEKYIGPEYPKGPRAYIRDAEGEKPSENKSMYIIWFRM